MSKPINKLLIGIAVLAILLTGCSDEPSPSPAARVFFPHPLLPRRQLSHPFLLQSLLQLLPPHPLRMRQLHPRPLRPRHPRLTLYNYAGPGSRW